MTTGSIEYSPDYKSEKRRPLNVVFEQGMERQRLQSERARLEREVIEAAKEYGRAARATEDHMKTADESQDSSAEGWRLLRDLESSWENFLLGSVYALLEFETQQK